MTMGAIIKPCHAGFVRPTTTAGIQCMIAVVINGFICLVIRRCKISQIVDRWITLIKIQCIVYAVFM